jgi:hypothetical protein
MALIDGFAKGDYGNQLVHAMDCATDTGDQAIFLFDALDVGSVAAKKGIFVATTTLCGRGGNDLAWNY